MVLYESSQEESPYYASTYTLLEQPAFWLNLMLGLASTCIPVYAFLRYKQLIGGNPMFDTKKMQRCEVHWQAR